MVALTDNALSCGRLVQFPFRVNVPRLDYQPLFGKGARALFSGRVDQTRESGGNRAYNVPGRAISHGSSSPGKAVLRRFALKISFKSGTITDVRV